jgi:hypothetical protein
MRLIVIWVNDFGSSFSGPLICVIEIQIEMSIDNQFFNHHESLLVMPIHTELGFDYNINFFGLAASNKKAVSAIPAGLKYKTRYNC